MPIEDIKMSPIRTEDIVSYSDGRSLSDVIIKTIGIHAATVIMVGHLTTLRSLPLSVQKYQVIGFFLVPALTSAISLHAISHSLRAIWSDPSRGDYSYYLSAMLGQRVTEGVTEDDDELSVPLLSVPYADLERVSSDRDIRWLARLFVIFCFVVQDLAILILYVRRWNLSFTAAFDDRNAAMALGGLVAGINALLITLTNWRWRPNRPTITQRVQLLDTEPTIRDVMVLETVTLRSLWARRVDWTWFTKEGATQVLMAHLLNYLVWLFALFGPFAIWIWIPGAAITMFVWVRWGLSEASWRGTLNPFKIAIACVAMYSAFYMLLRISALFGLYEHVTWMLECRRDASQCGWIIWKDPLEGKLWSF